MRSSLAISLALVFLAPTAYAAEQPKDEAVTIGPWQIEAAYKGQKFERCVMSRETPDGVNVRFTRDVDGLGLSMSSPK